MKYEIKICDEEFLVNRAQEFSDLCVKAFEEHKDRDIQMPPCSMTPSKWLECIKGCICFYIEDNNTIIAFKLVCPNHNTKIAEGRISAIAPQYKGQHFGYRLSTVCMEKLQEMGMNIYVTGTSIKATHVIAFHKSYGCKVVGMASWPKANYYSVCFQRALRPEFEISDEEAERRFKRSAWLCKLRYNEDGSRTACGVVLSCLPPALIRCIKRLFV